jgi:hypothetical protein
MHSLRLLTTILISISISVCTVKAENIAGTELNYRPIGNDQFEIDYLVYTDYPTSAPGTVVMLHYASASCGSSGSTTLLLQENRCVTYSSSCKNAGSSFTPTIRKWVYSGIVHFTDKCQDWKLSVNGCCRMAYITTVTDPELSIIRTEAQLNNLAGNFTSPVFANQPVFYFLSGQSNRINTTVICNDADSTTVRVVPARMATDKEVQYLPEFGYLQPFRSVPPLSSKAIKRELELKPSDPETGILDLQIDAWKNGILIGSVTRENRITVLESSNHLPELSGIDGTASFDVESCAGKNIGFYLFTSDEDAGDRVTLTMIDSLPGAVCSPSGDRTPAYRFEWKTPASDVADKTYIVRFRISDNNCPMPGVQQYAIRIHVAGLGITAAATPVSCIGKNDGSIKITVNEAMGPFSFDWKESGKTGAFVEGLLDGKHTLLLSNTQGCAAEYAVDVKGRAGFSPTSLSVIDATCSNTASGAAFISLPKPDESYDILWSPSGKRTLNVINLMPGMHTLTARDRETGCLMVKNLEVGYSFTAPSVDLGPDQFICAGQPVLLEAETGYRYYTWQNGSDSITHTVTEAGSYSVQVTDEYGCTGVGTVRVDFVKCQTANNPLGEDGIVIYPNPAQNLLNISFKNPTEGETQLFVTDLLGKQLMVSTVKEKSSSKTLEIDQLPDGVYLLYVEQGTNAAVYRFVKE